MAVLPKLPALQIGQPGSGLFVAGIFGPPISAILVSMAISRQPGIRKLFRHCLALAGWYTMVPDYFVWTEVPISRPQWKLNSCSV